VKNNKSFAALTLVNQSSYSAYDCEFVALARSCNTRLVTMDKKVAKYFPEMTILLPDINSSIQ